MTTIDYFAGTEVASPKVVTNIQSSILQGLSIPYGHRSLLKNLEFSNVFGSVFPDCSFAHDKYIPSFHKPSSGGAMYCYMPAAA